MNLNEYVERTGAKPGMTIEAAELLGGRGRRLRPGEFRYRDCGIAPADEAGILEELRADAAAALGRASDDTGLRLRIFVTGGTGFLGKEIVLQAARDKHIEQIVLLLRPKTTREGRSGAAHLATPQRRGEALLEALPLTVAQRRKFRFVAGNVERPGLGMQAEVAESLRREITHVVHSAANVSFDDTYERSFSANVIAARHALQFSRWLQETPGSRFVAHLAVGTSYLHGRCGETPAGEEQLAFPRDGFNNYYELTKAMAALEARRYLLRHRLRVIELCPAIVIGDQRTGNNRGDTKVVNAPVNFLGRTRGWLEAWRRGTLAQRTAAALAAPMTLSFPADAQAGLNLVTIDRAARGIVAASKTAAAVGRRVHLASGERVSASEIVRVMQEEMGIDVRLGNPRFHRLLLLPLACAALRLTGRERLARHVRRLGSVFAGYSERGQPLHVAANDMAILGLPERPSMVEALRMLCRHNEWVQEFGAIREAGEIGRRELAWAEVIERIEKRAGMPAGRLAAPTFRAMLMAQVALPVVPPRKRSEPAVRWAALPA